VNDHSENNSDFPLSARTKGAPKSLSLKQHKPVKCPYCGQTIYLPAEARCRRQPTGRVGRTPAKAPLFFEALRLFSEGVSWAKIARQFDPDGFLKDRAAARERIRKGAGHYKSSPGWLLVPLVPDDIGHPPGKK
jgi:hypothetical protein